ncbi:hypothetical protein NPIL_222061 [Nephila pilipes]|uniref:Uncharacterized protein n=1 Tax=Nephila pilipes TaxID=299642 RepID=A0A8X6UHV1_NEPPI|nr:hypothetical protein NPIL_222061 [Nephila pilipes]
MFVAEYQVRFKDLKRLSMKIISASFQNSDDISDGLHADQGISLAESPSSGSERFKIVNGTEGKRVTPQTFTDGIGNPNRVFPFCWKRFETSLRMV